MWKTPTYGHLLVDILQGIAKRNALLQVAGESVNPLIWTCLKIRHAGPQGSKSPKNRRSGSSARGECESGWGCILEDPTAGTHRQNPPRQSELRGFMSTGAFMNLSLSQKVSPTPTPISAEIRAVSAPQPTPLGKKGGWTPPLLCLKNNSIQTHPPPPLIALSWQVVGFLSVLLYKNPSEWPLLRKETWRTKILLLFQRFWPTRLHMTIKTQDNVTKRTWVIIHVNIINPDVSDIFAACIFNISIFFQAKNNVTGGIKHLDYGCPTIHCK